VPERDVSDLVGDANSPLPTGAAVGVIAASSAPNDNVSMWSCEPSSGRSQGLWLRALWWTALEKVEAAMAIAPVAGAVNGHPRPQDFGWPVTNASGEGAGRFLGRCWEGLGKLLISARNRGGKILVSPSEPAAILL
jgi:hypothetical protein